MNLFVVYATLWHKYILINYCFVNKIVLESEEEAPRKINIVLNWFEDQKERMSE